MKIPILLAAFFLTTPAIAREPEWRVGLASAKITPDAPVFMAGYASRDHAFEGVAADLHAKALALADGENHRAVLITTDLIGLTAEVAEPIRERIVAGSDLDPADILMSSSHTHTGPSLTLKTEPTTKMDAAQAERQAAYTRKLQDEIVRIALEALENAARPAELSWGTGVAHFVMNRREFTAERGVVLGVNPRGPVDRSVPVLKVAEPGEDGKLLAVLFQAACHNTTLGGNFYRITGDYAGYAQARVEMIYPGVQAMFMIGCGGDANPHPRGELEFSQQHGEALGTEVCRVLDGGKLKPVTGPLSTRLARAELPLQPAPRGKALSELRIGPGGWRGWVADQMQRTLDETGGLPAHYPAPFAVWQFGQSLTLVGMSGEVVVDFVYRLERDLGPLNLWIAAYCNDVYGYLPSKRVLREGGYETRGIYAGGIGFFTPEAEDVAVATIRELAEKAGRQIPESD